MGKIEERKSKIPTLIDFLYRDTSIIDSLYAQLFSGNLKQVQSEMSSTNENQSQLEGSLHFIKASKHFRDNTFERTTSSIDPHDAKIIELLDTIGISINTKSLTDCSDGEIVLLKGSAIIRNIDAINACLPIIESLGLLTETESSFAHSANGQIITKGLKTRNFKDTLEKMLNLISFPLHIEIESENDDSAICPINEQFLSMCSKDLLSGYGPSLPGKWSIIGIFSRVKPSRTYAITNPNNMRQVSDYLHNEIRKLANAGAPEFIIKPIVIYQELIVS